MKVHGLPLSLLLLATLTSTAQVRRVPISVNGRIPLGIESFRLEPAKQGFYLMASAENPAFSEMSRLIDGEKERLINGNGKPVTLYPPRIQFRLTASSREKLLEERPYGTQSKLSLDELFTKLHFRLKIFHGLEFRYVEPAFIEDIGMPRDLPYDERIYRIGFELGKVPIEDRVVMEVFSPSGERLCKFHLDLM